MTDLEKDVVALTERVDALEAVVRDLSRARAAEREKTETEDATPAPCPRCGGYGRVIAEVHGRTIAPGVQVRPAVLRTRECPDCTGRAPASPAPAAPLTGAELAAKHGFKPHGRDPLTGGVARDATGAPAAPEARGEEDAKARLWKVLDAARVYHDRDGSKGTRVTFGYEALASGVEALVNAERALARDAALEEAAAACDKREQYYRSAVPRYAEACDECARVVRSLRGKAESGEGGTP